jgi:hypothetical protein
MRHLLQPRVLKTASTAAAISALASYPRLLLWQHRPAPIWYLEATIFISCIILWGFVFAWHEPYTRRPVLILKLDLTPLIVATLTGIGTASAFHFWLDPSLRSEFPEEYPPDLKHWLAAVPFILAFNQLFLIFAPFDWLMRLGKNRWAATILTGLLGAVLLVMKIHTLSASIAAPLLAVMLAGRFVAGFLVIWLYLRGGVILVCWWACLIECRHLLDFIN